MSDNLKLAKQEVTEMIKYRLMTATKDGLLKRPTYNDYGHESNTYSDFDTIEEAYEAMDNGGEYIVVQVIYKPFVFDETV